MIEQAKEKLKQHAKDAMAAGQTDQFEQMLPQAEAAISQLPPLVSTFPVRDDGSQDNATHADVCMEWMNGAEGRKYSRGTEEERAAFENVHLHWTEETAAAKKNAPPQPVKPPSESVSMAVDKLPPELAAQAASKFYGLNASPQNFQVQDATETEQKITEKAADFGHGVIPPAGNGAQPAHSGAK
jgi:hypothetical protein